MSVEVVLDTPLAHALNSAIQPKLVEVGWSTGAEGSDLSEYIILMLANGKTQEQIAAELSGDLLNLGPDDPGARDFSQWLFHQVDALNSQQNGGNGGAQNAAMTQVDTSSGVQDADMGDGPEGVDGNVPTGPKSMRNGASRPRDKRMLGHLAKAMDRTNDSVLHRVRPQNGNERINTHSRGAPPTGPRGQQAPFSGRGGRGSMNPRMNGPVGGMPMQQGAAANIMNMTPQQQLELYAMLEQQSRLMAQMLNPQQQMPMSNGPVNGFQQQQPGRSLFDRVQRPQQNGGRKPHQNHSETPSSSMDVEMSQEKKEIDPETTTCRFNLTCTKADCPFAHQSPAAPAGTAIDYTDKCSFGAACKNRKCTGSHPSIAQQGEQECKFWPNCTNARCPYKHPTMPLCRNGGDCTTPNCKFSHSKTECKFNPCLKPNCIFKHVDGQKRGKFEDKVWTADSAKEHVSERKFVDENAPEELVVPATSDAGMSQASSATAELVT
ncbi:nuclear polyadenylated RNA-binding protein Nab2 [Hyaloscypha variabilis F]|uniref:Nuclear polyadenylated RNA-binding protein Nab2 n=1 Tax=Hyaloscypha variabilis (strain UAMH 11265 / GT02V1 / F) TaxID=1149755 RepID=A0A2J6QYA3_HYAVF|nr:nuclear polyadenylated RNA-binding protein Nab2 [Hyaloscypha variabilis F]